MNRHCLASGYRYQPSRHSIRIVRVPITGNRTVYTFPYRKMVQPSRTTGFNLLYRTTNSLTQSTKFLLLLESRTGIIVAENNFRNNKDGLPCSEAIYSIGNMSKKPREILRTWNLFTRKRLPTTTPAFYRSGYRKPGLCSTARRGVVSDIGMVLNQKAKRLLGSNNGREAGYLAALHLFDIGNKERIVETHAFKHH